MHIMIFSEHFGIIMFVPSCARQGNDGGILWEVYIKEVILGGSSIIGKGSVFVKVQEAPKKW